MSERKKILNAFIKVGGLIGHCAREHYDNKALADQLIYEISDDCDKAPCRSMLGEDLANSVVLYSKNKPKK